MRLDYSDFGIFSWLPPGYFNLQEGVLGEVSASILGYFPGCRYAISLCKEGMLVRFECSDLCAFSWLLPGYLTTRRDRWVRFNCSDFGAFSRLPLGELRLFKI